MQKSVKIHNQCKKCKKSVKMQKQCNTFKKCKNTKKCKKCKKHLETQMYYFFNEFKKNVLFCWISRFYVGHWKSTVLNWPLKFSKLCSLPYFTNFQKSSTISILELYTHVRKVVIYLFQKPLNNTYFC